MFLSVILIHSIGTPFGVRPWRDLSIVIIVSDAVGHGVIIVVGFKQTTPLTYHLVGIMYLIAQFIINILVYLVKMISPPPAPLCGIKVSLFVVTGLPAQPLLEFHKICLLNYKHTVTE